VEKRGKVGTSVPDGCYFLVEPCCWYRSLVCWSDYKYSEVSQIILAELLLKLFKNISDVLMVSWSSVFHGIWLQCYTVSGIEIPIGVSYCTLTIICLGIDRFILWNYWLNETNEAAFSSSWKKGLLAYCSHFCKAKANRNWEAETSFPLPSSVYMGLSTLSKLVQTGREILIMMVIFSF
jgi:hypothetical protein